MLKVEFDNSQPIYAQIITVVKKALVLGTLSPGDKLPSQRDFAAQLKVNPNTVQRAYRDMEQLGLTETLRGQGTFIKQGDKLVDLIKGEMLDDLVSAFIVEMRSLGCDDLKIIAHIEHKLELEGER